MSRVRITLNQVACLRCDDVITSKHSHDFVQCTCKAVAIDGGHDYLKRVGNVEDYKELSESEEIRAHYGEYALKMKTFKRVEGLFQMEEWIVNNWDRLVTLDKHLAEGTETKPGDIDQLIMNLLDDVLQVYEDKHKHEKCDTCLEDTDWCKEHKTYDQCWARRPEEKQVLKTWCFYHDEYDQCWGRKEVT